MSNKLETLIDAYHNGQIDFVKNKLNHWNISFSDLFNHYIDIHGELLFTEDIKLFVRRLT